MNYHHRYNQDGSYEIICTRCFLTVGLAAEEAAARKLEAQHNCPKANLATAAPEFSDNHPRLIPRELSRLATQSLRFVGTAKETHLVLLCLTVIFVFYVLPTGLEFVASTYLGPWVGIIFLGDFCACVCLATVFKLRRASITLYAVLTIFEGALFASHLLSASALLWITDSVPTLVLMATIVRLPASGMRHMRSRSIVEER
jgi:hypothetical protein